MSHDMKVADTLNRAADAVKHADAQQIENSSRAIRGAILQEQWGLEDAGVPRVVV